MAADASVNESGAVSRAPHASLAKPRSDTRLGTGHGALEASHVEDTEFTSATSTPEQIVRLRYDSYTNLVARGVIPQPTARPPVIRRPNPFPKDGYVPDPPVEISR